MSYPLEDLDAALRDAIFGFANTGVTDPEPIVVPAEVIAALEPLQPVDEIDALIGSVGATWPLTVVSWGEYL